ncbi:MAG: hypothetical protein ACRCSK_04505, partial [Fusobacteriaceae bacterium]
MNLILLSPLIIIMSGLFVLPLYHTFSYSLGLHQFVGESKFHLNFYRELFAMDDFKVSLFYTIKISLISSLVSFLLSSLVLFLIYTLFISNNNFEKN